MTTIILDTLEMRTVTRQKDAIALYRALNELILIYQFRDRDLICCHDISITQCYGLEELVHHGPLMLNEPGWSSGRLDFPSLMQRSILPLTSCHDSQRLAPVS